MFTMAGVATRPFFTHPNVKGKNDLAMQALMKKDITKTRNGTINRMMHGRGKFHGKAALLM